ncbi:hypothetical protein ONA70_32130 [Micromonospora yasonensis]|uniref:hypothetical protein n=1 Tax=Micromonospora yasonensis TaxID=1128667 RepID=UPI002231C34D|nr:hypothetical protein [Micromonospora yasonensis]MCW3844737.1 hypothetical protein [Micromonospora yasonensis]
MAQPQDRLSEMVAGMRRDGAGPFAAVVRLKEQNLVQPGREFDAAHALKRSYGLSVVQLHEVVGWLKGERTLEDVRRALQDRS